MSVHPSLLSISSLFFFYLHFQSIYTLLFVHSFFFFFLFTSLHFFSIPFSLSNPSAISSLSALYFFFALTSYPFCIHDSLFLRNSIEKYSKRDKILLRFSRKWQGEWRKHDLNSINPHTYDPHVNVILSPISTSEKSIRPRSIYIAKGCASSPPLLSRR